MAGVASSSTRASWIRSACASGDQMRAAGAPAVPVSRPVEDDDAILLGGLVEEPARTRSPGSCCRCRAAGRAARPCHARRSASGHHRSRGIVLGGIAALCILGKPSVDQGRDGEGGDADDCCGCVGMISEVSQLLACARPRCHKTTLDFSIFHMPAPFGSGLNPMLRVCCDAIYFSNPTGRDGSFAEEACADGEVTASIDRNLEGPPTEAATR